jgi:caffeoyl-CoA O-methyltransferase
MNARTFITLFLCTALTMLQSCKSGQSNDIVAENFNFAAQQLQYAIDLTTEAISKDTRDSARRASRPLVSPRTLEKDGSLKVVTAHDWTSGFFPGELWFMYEMTNDPAWEERARKFTEPLQVLRYHTGTHDLGFMMYNSFGNGLRLTGDQEYILSHIDAEPDLLRRIERETHVRMLRSGMISGHLQGRLLTMLTRMIRPERVLEVGTFVGYSALCFAEGLEDGGEVHTIEVDDELEDYIRSNFSQSEYGDRIKLFIGDALQIIPGLEDEGYGLAFIDADKESYWECFESILPKVKKGGFILADNTLWYGKVVEEVGSSDWATQGILKFNERVARDERVEKVILPIRDGITVIRKK